MVELEEKTFKSEKNKNNRSFEITGGEIIDLEGITDYKWKIYEPLLIALRTTRIQTASGEIQISPITYQKVKSILPENTSRNSIYTTFQTLNSVLLPSGWSIVRQGETPRIPIDAPWFLRGPGDKLGKNPRGPGSQKKPSRGSMPMHPHPQEIELLPTSPKFWDFQEINRRQEIENLEILRQEFKFNITLNVLSLIRADAMEKLKKIAKDTSHGRNTYGTSFDSAIGINPKEDKETKERKRKKFVVSAVNETLDRLWGKQLKLATPKERQILTMCMELEQNGKAIQDVKNALSEALGVDLPERPNLTSSPAL